MPRHPTTQIYNKDGSLNKVTIPKAAHDGLEGPLKNEFNAKQISDSIKQEHGRLPNKAVSKGDTWVRKEVMPLGAGQVLNLRVDYTYEGIIEKNNQQPRSHHRQSHRRRLRNERPRRRPAHGKGQRPQSRQIKN